MATQQTSAAGRLLVAPSVILLFLWMIVPLAMTLYFSTLRYLLLDPDRASSGWRTIRRSCPTRISLPR